MRRPGAEARRECGPVAGSAAFAPYRPGGSIRALSLNPADALFTLALSFLAVFEPRQVPLSFNRSRVVSCKITPFEKKTVHEASTTIEGNTCEIRCRLFAGPMSKFHDKLSSFNENESF